MKSPPAQCLDQFPSSLSDTDDREENPQMVPTANTNASSFQPDPASGESKNLYPDTTHPCCGRSAVYMFCVYIKDRQIFTVEENLNPRGGWPSPSVSADGLM